jgi:hypothetical protein
VEIFLKSSTLYGVAVPQRLCAFAGLRTDLEGVVVDEVEPDTGRPV